jgi:hypothetical protein
MREVIREDQARRYDSTQIGHVVSGYVEERVNVLPPNSQVYVAYYDSTRSLIIDDGTYDISTTSDSTFSLIRADTVIPRTLSVAMRNVGGVYRPKDVPEASVSNGSGTLWLIVSIVVIGLGILALAALASLSASFSSMAIPIDFAP